MESGDPLLVQDICEGSFTECQKGEERYEDGDSVKLNVVEKEVFWGLTQGRKS